MTFTPRLSAFLNADGSFDLAFIRDRAETIAKAHHADDVKDAAHLSKLGLPVRPVDEIFREILSREMTAATDARQNNFGAFTVTAPEGTPEWYRQLSIAEAIACGEEYSKPTIHRDLDYAYRCFERAESYAARAGAKLEAAQ